MITYTVMKTNKKTVKYQFETIEALNEYATKNRYGQGYVDLFTTYKGKTYQIVAVTNLYNLNDYCTKMVLAERSQNETK